MPMPFGPMMGMGMGFGVQSAGPLAPPRMPWNTPGLLGNPSTERGACVPGMPWLGFSSTVKMSGDGSEDGSGDDLPAPAEVGDCVPPFAPGVPLWAGGTIPGLGMMGLGGIGLGGMGLMGMGMGMRQGMNNGMTGMNRMQTNAGVGPLRMNNRGQHSFHPYSR